MSKKLAALTSLVTFLSLTGMAYAQQQLINPGSGFVNPGTTTATQSVSNTTTLVVNGLFTLGAILAVVYLILGGVRWITSRGDKNGVEAARRQIVAAIIGLIVVAVAFFALNIVFGLLGANNPLKGNFELPTLTNPNPTP